MLLCCNVVCVSPMQIWMHFVIHFVLHQLLTACASWTRTVMCVPAVTLQCSSVPIFFTLVMTRWWVAAENCYCRSACEWHDISWHGLYCWGVLQSESQQCKMRDVCCKVALDVLYKPTLLQYQLLVGSPWTSLATKHLPRVPISTSPRTCWLGLVLACETMLCVTAFTVSVPTSVQ